MLRPGALSSQEGAFCRGTRRFPRDETLSFDVARGATNVGPATVSVLRAMTCSNNDIYTGLTPYMGMCVAQC